MRASNRVCAMIALRLFGISFETLLWIVRIATDTCSWRTAPGAFAAGNGSGRAEGPKAHNGGKPGGNPGSVLLIPQSGYPERFYTKRLFPTRSNRAEYDACAVLSLAPDSPGHGTENKRSSSRTGVPRNHGKQPPAACRRRTYRLSDSLFFNSCNRSSRRAPSPHMLQETAYTSTPESADPGRLHP